MKEIIKTLVNTSVERLRNPFIGSFIFAWIAFNWRPLIYLAKSKVNILKQIETIDSRFVSVENGLLYPIIVAVFYIVILPYLNLLFEYLVVLANKKRKENITKLKIIETEQEIRLVENKFELEKKHLN